MLRFKGFSVLALVMVWVMALSVVAMAAPEGMTQISNTLSGSLEPAGDGATVLINQDLSPKSVVGLWDEFSVTTYVAEEAYAGTMVRARIEIVAGDAAGFDLEYFETGGGQNVFKELNFQGNEAWFGPAGGFPLIDGATSYFRVTWNEPGNYEFKVSLVKADDPAAVVAENTSAVEVVAGEAINLSWQDGKEEYTYDADGKAETATVTASLNHDITHVDSVLYIIELTKGDGEAATPEDITITGTGGQQLGYDADGGFFYWGPQTGIQFGGCDKQSSTQPCVNDTETTDFEATVHNLGTKFTIEAYAVQLEGTPQGVLIKGN